MKSKEEKNTQVRPTACKCKLCCAQRDLYVRLSFPVEKKNHERKEKLSKIFI